MICVMFRSDCFKNDVLCEAKISGFDMCSNMRECLDFGKYITRAALMDSMKGWKALVLNAVVCSKQRMFSGYQHITQRQKAS